MRDKPAAKLPRPIAMPNACGYAAGMWHGSRIAVIVPAFNEARLIERTLRGMPAFVDYLCVVDDASSDETATAALKVDDDRVQVVRHATNRGVGAAIATGYGLGLRHGADVLVVMAGDNQMHPSDLPALLEPIVHGHWDYAKGNRFQHPDVHLMPAARRHAGRALSALTRWATGLHVHDCQCGYTALRASAARSLPLQALWPRFGYPNDLLGLLAAAGLEVCEVPVRPVYAGEASGLRPWHALSISGVILRRWWRSQRRLAERQERSARSMI